MQEEPVRTRAARDIAADPTSTALLLASPAAVELWPGVERVAEAGGRVLVEVETEGRPRTAATVSVEPPRRTPTSYVVPFAFSGPDLPSTSGTLTLAYGPGSAVPGTRAVLELRSTGLADAARAERLQALAARFLERLGRAAEQRARAA